MDVRSLRTNILNHKGIKAIKKVLNKQTEKPMARKVMVKFLFSVLTCINFVLNAKIHLQKEGCSMGNKSATS